MGVVEPEFDESKVSNVADPAGEAVINRGAEGGTPKRPYAHC